MLDCFGYVIDFLVKFLFPIYEVIGYPGLVVSTIAEVSFLLWLSIMGAKVRQPDNRAPDALFIQPVPRG
jgi:hypothetical protein